MVTSASPAVVTEMTRCAETLGFRIHRSEANRPNQASFFGFSNGVRPWLRHHGLSGKTSHTKRVPSAIFACSNEAVAEFIGGYWDCDGVVSVKGKDRHGESGPILFWSFTRSAKIFSRTYSTCYFA